MNTKHENLISVIVLNWNGLQFLEACLRSLTQQSLSEIEIILVDNGSNDGSVKFIRKYFPEVRVIELDQNMGFSKGVNVGIHHSTGKYVALLNNDAEADPYWLGELVSTLDQHPEIGMCASKMFLYSNHELADACGDYYSIEGIPGKIGHLESANKYCEPRHVFGASAGAAIYRRSMLEDIGPFDEDFFMIYEDSDLSFRAQLNGYKCRYVASAVVYHHVGATIGIGTDIATYYIQRNMEFAYIKNMPLSLLVKYFPLHLIANCLFLFGAIRRGQFLVFIKAKFDAIKLLPKMLKKRHKIQQNRKAPDKEIDRILHRGWLVDRIANSIWFNK